MPNRTISTLTNGNVIVIHHTDGAAAAEMREYKRRGRLIYLVREGCVPQPMCRGLRTHGDPLFIRSGERLEEAIRAQLAEQDGARSSGPAFKFAVVMLACALAMAALVDGLGDLAALGFVR